MEGNLTISIKDIEGAHSLSKQVCFTGLFYLYKCAKRRGSLASHSVSTQQAFEPGSMTPKSDDLTIILQYHPGEFVLKKYLDKFKW